MSKARKDRRVETKFSSVAWRKEKESVLVLMERHALRKRGLQ